MHINRLREAIVLLSLGAVFLLDSQVLAAGNLKYQFKGMDEVYYQVSIKAELPDSVDTSSGMIQYQIKSVDPANGQIRLGYTAQLSQQRQMQANSRRGLPGRPPFVPPRFPFGIGGAAPDIVISPQGKVVQSNRSGDEAQLPYMMGLDWQLMLPTLAADGKNTWSEDRPITLYAKSERGWPPMSPWRGPGEERVDRPAHERITCSLGRPNGAIVPITRQYELSADQNTGGSPRLRQSGKSQIMFDTNAGLVQSMEAQYTIDVNETNVSVRIPVTVSARLATPDEIAKIKAQREAQAAKIKEQLARDQANRDLEKAIENKTIRTPEIGNSFGTSFIRVDAALRPVIGLRITLGNWMGRACIRQIDPLYEKPAEEAAESKTTILMAKPGYAVGGLVFNTAEAPKKDLYGMQVIFMRMGNDTLDKADSYRSQWFAVVKQGTPKIVLGGKGDVVVGVFGQHSQEMNSVGLILKNPNAGGATTKDGEKSPDEINADSLPKN